MNLDLLPIPDFSDFPLDRYYSPSPVLPYLSSRGCPWRRCAFCTHQKTYLDYREQDPGVAARNLSSLKRAYGVTFFSLVDEMIQPKRLDRLCGHLEAEDNAIIFSAYAKPSKGFHPDFLRRAHRCGLRVMMWGVESGSQRVLDLMRKGTRVEEVGKVLKDASEAKIWNLVFAIFGFPTETQTEWQATLDFLEANRDRIDALSKSRFLLVEGSDIFQHPGRYGITAVKDRPQRDPVSIAYDYEVAVGMSQHEIQNKFRDSLPVLSGTGRSPWFGQFRDHMLIFAAVASGQAVSPRSG